MKVNSMSVYFKIFLSEIKCLLIGSAILDIWAEQNNKKSYSIFPNLNPYYYKIKRLNNNEKIDLSCDNNTPPKYVVSIGEGNVANSSTSEVKNDSE